MFRLEYIDTGDIRDLRAQAQFRGPAVLLATRCRGGTASTQANPATLTTSGTSSPITSGPGASATAGSIALGSGANYLESGSKQVAGSKNVGNTVGGSVTAGTGATVDVGYTANQLTQVAQAFGAGLGGGGGGGDTVVTSAPASSGGSLFSGTTELWILAGLALLALLALFRGGHST